MRELLALVVSLLAVDSPAAFALSAALTAKAVSIIEVNTCFGLTVACSACSIVPKSVIKDDNIAFCRTPSLWSFRSVRIQTACSREPRQL
jgi:hypothetical protein